LVEVEDSEMRIARRLLKVVFEHAREAYPFECFGYLVGSAADLDTVQRVVRGTNRSRRARREYLMDVEEFAALEKMAEEKDERVIGFYHSHPDGGVRPSALDRAALWVGVTYLIVAVHEGRVTGAAAWRLPKRVMNVMPVDLVVTGA
jgi:desampylase